MISATSTGSWDNLEKFLTRSQTANPQNTLKGYGQAGVRALAKATPKETGETSLSWDFRIIQNKGGYRIEWLNHHVNDGLNIAVAIQYGHGTGTGGWVPGIDYINPAMSPLMDKIIDDFWKEVTK